MKAAAVVLAVLIAAAVGQPRGDGHVRPAYRLPGTIATVQIGGGLGAVTGGAGDAWVDDRWDERLVRLDRGTGSVVARIPVDGRLALTAGAGSLWALQSGGGYGRGLRGPLLRIDPATNRVVARIALGALGFGLAAQGESLWIWGPDDLIRVDARTNLVAQRIAVASEHGETTGFALVGDQPVITTADGHLIRFDARSGAEARAVTVPFASPALQSASPRRAVLIAGGDVAAVDPRTGAALWRTRLGFRVGSVLETGGVLWAYGAYVRDPGDRVWQLDPDRGAILGSVLLPAFSTMGMAIVDGTIWVSTAGGRVLVLGLS
jgi:outer membrane protein assembly factor BamB